MKPANSNKSVRVEVIRPRLLCYDDAARFLGISVKTLRNWVSLKRYPALKPKRLGGKPLFDARELEKFCDTLNSDEGVA